MNPEEFCAIFEDHPAAVRNLGELLDKVAAFVRRFIALDSVQADVIALWVVHTHCFDAAETTPYLAIISPEKRCGKTTLLRLLRHLVREPLKTSNISVSALFRTIEEKCPTLLLDEVDAIFGRKAPANEELRGLLNSGNDPDDVFIRNVGEGKNMRPAAFRVFCPKALAAIRGLPDTVADRSFRIRLSRKLPEEITEKFRHKLVKKEAEPLRVRLKSWAAAHTETLRGASPTIPAELDDRAQDGAEPLLAIADAAGVEWPERARRALVDVCTGEEAADESHGTRLLQDCRMAFLESNAPRIFSEELCRSLARNEESPWPEWSHGKPITPRGLARALEVFGIRPKDLRIGDERRKGYEASAFAEAWKRYAPAVPVPEGSDPRQLRQVNIDEGFPHLSDPRQAPAVADVKTHELSIDTGFVADVADETVGRDEIRNIDP